MTSVSYCLDVLCGLGRTLGLGRSCLIHVEAKTIVQAYIRGRRCGMEETSEDTDLKVHAGKMSSKVCSNGTLQVECVVCVSKLFEGRPMKHGIWG